MLHSPSGHTEYLGEIRIHGSYNIENIYVRFKTIKKDRNKSVFFRFLVPLPLLFA